MDVDNFIKSRFPQYYKANISNFGTSLLPEKRTTRKKQQNLERKNVRSQVLLERRNISESPLPEIEHPVEPKRARRKDLLKQWKEQKKLKLEEEKTKRKPVFKLACPANVGFPVRDKNPVNERSIAPKDFKFKPPKNIHAISLAKSSKNTSTVNQCSDNKTKANISSANKRVTRSQKAQASPPLPLPRRTKKSIVLKDNGSSKDSSVLRSNAQREREKKPLVRQLAVRHESVDEAKEVAAATVLTHANKDEINDKTIGKRKSRKQSLKPNLNDTYEIHDNNLTSNNDCTNQKENVLSSTEDANSVEELEIKHRKVSMSTKTPKSRRQSRRKSRKNASIEGKQNESFSSSEENKLASNTSLSLSPEYPIIDVVTTDDNNTPEQNTTPNNQDSVIYVSPFVTTSRGKGSVKKENRKRQTHGLPAFTEHNTPDEDANKKLQRTGAAYFHTVLDNETSRLLSLCNKWNTFKDVEKLTEDAKDLIDVAVGQANLLINKKFQQFRGLINSCQTGEGEKLITCEDLQGFWDMVYMQVENLNLRFNRLSELKDNYWAEIMPEIKSKVAKRKAPPKRAKASSKLKAAIEACRNAMKTRSQKRQSERAETDPVFEGSFFVVKSPNVISSAQTSRKTPVKNQVENRTSLLASVLRNETRKSLAKSKESPGVIIMAVSQTAKELKRISTGLESVVLPQTPTRSILKSSRNRKNSHINKTVLFQDDSSDLENSLKEQTQSKRRSSDMIWFDSPISKRS